MSYKWRFIGYSTKMPILAAIWLLWLITIVGVGFIICKQPARSQAQRVQESPRNPYRLLSKQFAGSTAVFTTADPSLAGSALTLTSATGNSRMDGVVTVALQAGFTAPVTLTVYYWQMDNVTGANAGWTRIGAVASDYSQSFDSNYTMRQFAIQENTPFLIRSSANITGNVYTDCPQNTNNANTVAGYQTN
jgi:hypothetical protein